MPILTFPPQLHTGALFLLSGGLATALHWGLMAMLLHSSVGAGVATAAGAALGAASNYVLQFHVTFRGRARHRRAIPAYLIAASACWLINLVLFSVFHAGAQLAVLSAQGLTSALVALLNFSLYKRVVFS